MPPIFFSENIIAITLKFTYMIHKILPLWGYFLQSRRHFQHTSANVELDAVYQCCKTLYLDLRAHHENYVSVCCHL
jgi:hypothetical protein